MKNLVFLRTSYFGRVLCAGLFLCSLVLVPVSRADTSYRWIDQNGRIVYGSKPPANAKHVSRLKTKPLSRYSSDKMLNRLGYRARPSRKQAPAPNRVIQSTPAVLEHGEITIAVDAKNRITACSVPINNPTSRKASEISVAFEFPDGTLIPGVGPDSISAKSEVEFTVPAELLPLTLEGDYSEKDDTSSMLPKIIIHGIEG